MILVGYDAAIFESWIFCGEAPTRTDPIEIKPEVKTACVLVIASVKPTTWSTYIIMLERRMSMRSTLPVRRQGESLPTAAAKKDRVKRTSLRSRVLEEQ
jgi:hypothetical protein